MNQDANPADFVALVSDLTGVSQKIVGQAEAAASYLAQFTGVADKIAGAGATAALVAAYATLRAGLPPEKAVAALLDGALDPKSPCPNWPFSAMARSLMKLVLLGLWIDPTVPPPNDGVIPTAALYSESLVWLIAQAHPVGASKLAFGYWASPPPSLSDLIG